jgi:hypothetical protein
MNTQTNVDFHSWCIQVESMKRTLAGLDRDAIVRRPLGYTEDDMYVFLVRFSAHGDLLRHENILTELMKGAWCQVISDSSVSEVTA